MQDVRIGLRMLVRSPVFSVFAIGSLMLGIGAAAAIFSLLDAIVWRQLPVREPERLVAASITHPRAGSNSWLPYPQFAAMRDRATALEGLFAVAPVRVAVTAGADAAITDGLYVSGDYYRTLGIAPAAGRLFTADDDRPGNASAVISYALWQRLFGGRPDVVGSAVRLNQVPFTVVGVEPAGFTGVETGRLSDISIPLRAMALLNHGVESRMWTMTDATWINVMGRLKPGAAIEPAVQELNLIYRQVAMDGAPSAEAQRFAADTNLQLASGARGTRSGLRHTYEDGLRFLIALVGGVLLLAALNLATLLLARSASRRQEIATRMALGAGRGRIIRQFLTESLVLAAIAAAGGLLLAWWESRALLQLAVPAAERLTVDLTPGARTVAFTIAASVLASVVFGLIPAWRATSQRQLTSVRQVGAGRGRRIADRALVASQVALSLTLLAIAGLFLGSLNRLWSQEPGYDRRNVLMFSVEAALSGTKPAEAGGVYRRLLDGLRTVPGAGAVTAAVVRPVTDSYYLVDSVGAINQQTRPADQRIRIAFNEIAPGYFGSLGIPLLAGRDFDDRDSPASPLVAIVSERMGRYFTGSPVGQTITMGDQVREVIGVAKDTRYANVKDAPRDVVYLPLFQAKEIGWRPSFLVRYEGRPDEVMRSVREAAARVDPALALTRVRTLEAQTADSLSRERLLATLTTYAGAFAVLLACVGLYGLMSFGVAQRTAEMGIRMALGARPAEVRWLIVREGAATALAGIAAGAVATLALVPTLRSLLFGIEPRDPATLAAAIVLLAAVAFGATYLPARRASRIEPSVALRAEG